MTKTPQSPWLMSHVTWRAVSVIAVLVAAFVAVAFRYQDGPAAPRVLGEHFTASLNGGGVVKSSSSTGNNGCGRGNGGASGSKDCSNPGHPLNVTGVIVGDLYPGGLPASLQVTVANPNNQDLQLQKIDVSLGAPSIEGCDPDWFSVARYAGPTVTVPKQDDIMISLDLTMNDAAESQDICQDATFPVNFTATATGA